MRKFLLAGAAAMALVACANLEAAKEVEAPIPAELASPQFGDWGVDLSVRDEAVDPGDDFYRHVNGKWLATFEIPADKSNYGSFTALGDLSEKRVAALIEEMAGTDAKAGSNAQKVGDLYASFMDEAAIAEKGLAPVQADLDRINALASHEDVARAFGSPSLPASSPWAGWVDVDDKDPTRHVFYLTQSGLGLPDRDFYLQDDERFTKLRAGYKDVTAFFLKAAGYSEADAAAYADKILAVETELAKVHWEQARRRDSEATYNLMTLAEIEAAAPRFPWKASLDEAGLGAAEEMVVRETDAIFKSADIFADTPVDTWRAYLTAHYLFGMAPYLPAEYDEAAFAFFGKALRGVPEQRARWKRGVSLVEGALGEAVGEAYVKRYFPPRAKTEMDALVANLRLALDDRLKTLDWMTDETRAQAKEKLDAFTPKIGYPTKWEDYSALSISRDDLVANIKATNAWGWADMIADLGKPVDKTKWFMTPQTVNAYYAPNRNEIVFPAAILQAPFFDPDADPAVNYGAIGAVIGHEIGHGFDDEGRKYDGTGTLRDWWTAADAEAFEARAKVLGEQYAAYEPVAGYKLDPNLTMGENIGDLGGLSMAYHAYKLSLKGEAAPVLDGLTGDQRFFMAWAQVWRRLYREEELVNRIKTDPHSPSEFRTNGVVRNMDAWYEAFGVTEDDALYLPPEKRVKIW